MGVMRDLLRKPHREIPTQRGEAEQRHDVEEIKQMRISHILARALAFIRNGQQSEALRELAKQELKDLSEINADNGGGVRTDGQAFPQGKGR